SPSICSLALTGSSVLRAATSSLTPALTRSRSPTRAPFPFLPFLISSAIGSSFLSCPGSAAPVAVKANLQLHLHLQVRPIIIELARLTFRPLVQLGHVHENLPVGRRLHVCAVHGPRSRSLKIHSFAVITTSVTWAFEFVLCGFPIGSAAQVSATSVDHEQAIRSAIYPNPILLLKFCIHSKCEVRRITDFERRARFKKGSWKKETKEREEPGP